MAPAPGDPDVGIFSGCALVNKQGVPTIVYHGVGAGTCVATACDDDLTEWTKSPHNPVIPEPKEGDPEYGVYRVHDPHTWLEGDTYYTILNGLVTPGKVWDTAYLFKSPDLIHWQYLHPFYTANPEWTGEDEDCACPDFFPLGDRHMLLCISHTRGARYYLGRHENETFHPEKHHRMNWPGGTCFAPESLLDDRGRRIFWAWACEARTRAAQDAAGWSGVMTLPRVLSLGDDGRLHIAPADELACLRLNHRRQENISLGSDEERVLDNVAGSALEIAIDVQPHDTGRVGLKVACSPDGAEQTVITYDPTEQTLAIDTSQSTLDDQFRCPFPSPHAAAAATMRGLQDIRKQVAPLALAPGEPLRLRVFLDKSILEVFANQRQCVTQRIYPTRADSVSVAVFCHDAPATILSLDAWDMAAAGT